jgi:hypothetical protein
MKALPIAHCIHAAYQSMSRQWPYFEKRSVCLPGHCAVAYLCLVRRFGPVKTS